MQAERIRAQKKHAPDTRNLVEEAETKCIQLDSFLLSFLSYFKLIPVTYDDLI